MPGVENPRLEMPEVENPRLEKADVFQTKYVFPSGGRLAEGLTDRYFSAWQLRSDIYITFIAPKLA